MLLLLDVAVSFCCVLLLLLPLLLPDAGGGVTPLRRLIPRDGRGRHALEATYTVLSQSMT